MQLQKYDLYMEDKSMKTRSNITILRVIKILLMGLMLVSLVAVQTIPSYAESVVSFDNMKTADKLDKCIATGELEHFTNEKIKKSMQEYEIPGTVVAIVKNGKIVFIKGYGYANLNEKKPMTPDKTKIRIASVTKLFTANAVMQLVEKNKINLNADVNDYLNEFKLKNPYKDKVTMAQLLTHTSGIDNDCIKDLSVKESDVKPISQFLKARMLPVVRKPGTVIQYSSYGTALAGCIVEEVSGQSCAEYIKNNILDPLEMHNTDFEMNPADLAQGYVRNGRMLEEKELKGYFNLYPVGGIVSTGEDMAKFMIAHLNNGQYNGRRIMQASTALSMHQRHAGFDALLPGTCYGFAEGYTNGIRSIGHPGYAPDGFSTELCLLPEKNVGIFITVNQGYDNSVPQEFVNDFIGHYYPESKINNGRVEKRETPNKEIVGTYRFGEYTRSTINKGDIFGAGEEVDISINGNDVIIKGVDPFTRKTFITNAIQIAPMVLKSADGEYFVFKKDEKGKVAYMAQTSTSWHGTFEKISWYEKNAFQLGLFLICNLIFLLEIIISLIVLVRSKMKKRSGKSQNKLVNYQAALIGMNSLLNILFYAISMMTWGDRLRYGVPIDIKLLLCLPVICSILTVMIFAGTVQSWKKNYGSLFFRINATVVTTASVFFIWLYNYLNLLGFKY